MRGRALLLLLLPQPLLLQLGEGAAALIRGVLLLSYAQGALFGLWADHHRLLRRTQKTLCVGGRSAFDADAMDAGARALVQGRWVDG